MLSRRELIGKAAVGATAALTLSAARTGLASGSGRALPGPTDDPGGSRGAPGDPADGRTATDAPGGDRARRNSEPPPADPVALPAPLRAPEPLRRGVGGRPVGGRQAARKGRAERTQVKEAT